MEVFVRALEETESFAKVDKVGLHFAFEIKEQADKGVDMTVVIVAVLAVLALPAAGVAFWVRKKFRNSAKIMQELSEQHSMQLASDKYKVEKIAQLEKSLEQARKIVSQVAAEGGSQLSQFKLDYAALSFDDPVTTLGEGAFGTVLKGVLIQTKRKFVVAVKTVRTTKMTRAAVRAFMSEIKVMAPLSHPGLVKLYGGCWDNPDELCIVLEFCAHGTLRGLFGVPEVLTLLGGRCALAWSSPYHGMMVSMAECFRYLHHEQVDGNPLIHRDLKPENVLVSETADGQLVLKVADFGESRRMSLQEAEERRNRNSASEEEKTDEDLLSMTRV